MFLAYVEAYITRVLAYVEAYIWRPLETYFKDIYSSAYSKAMLFFSQEFCLALFDTVCSVLLTAQ